VTAPSDRSYRAILGVPYLARALVGMQFARVAESMIGVTLVLFCLTRYASAELAGLANLVALAPGLLTSPVTGALLDRHGRIRLIQLDFALAGLAFFLIGGLALADLMPAWLLLVIAGLSSFTAPLSNTGLRTLFPLMAPRHLWEPVNALDSNGYVVASIVGPPVAAILVGVVGAPLTFLVAGAMLAAGTLLVHGIPEPAVVTASSGRILVDAWQGLRYAWSNRTIRALGFTFTSQNVAWGALQIVIPVIVLRELGQPEAVVGLVFAAQGLAGAAVGLLAGRLDTRGRERRLILIPLALSVPGAALLLAPHSLLLVIAVLLWWGALVGPADVAMFTLRQRRTDPAWMGRAFAVSMSMNFAGFPLGSAVAGVLAERDPAAAVVMVVAATVASVVFAWRLIPARDVEFEPGAAAAVAAVEAAAEA
jgi:MFS family permease